MEKKDLQKIKKYFQKVKAVTLVYLYGSQARGEAKKDSDIDLAVLVEEPQGSILSSDVQLKAMADLSLLLKKEVEVQNLNICKITFAYRVISEGKIIYEAKANNRLEFEMEVMEKYFDLKPLLDEYNFYLAERARKKMLTQTLYPLKILKI